MRRYGFEENRVFRVLAVAVAIGGWLLLSPGLPATSELIPPIPRLSSDGPVVKNGVAVIMACGKKRGFEVVGSAPEPRTGTWGVERRGACNVYYHHRPARRG